MKLLPTFLLVALAALYTYRLVRRRDPLPPTPDRAVNELPEAHREPLDSYQALLDESLQLTFPASDPVSAHAATRCAQATATAADTHDWQLHPGSHATAGAPPRD